MTEYEYAISVQDVGKRYDRFALEHISFTVPKGSIMGFIGQNGAGKTTTIRSMLHITSIDQGEIRLLGMDHIRQEQAIKERLAVVFDELPFHGVLTPKDMARIFAGLYPDWDNAAYSRYLEQFQLPVKKKIGQFSKGMKMKLQIACALSHNAELLIMDEPTTGLDPVVRDEILHLFMEYIRDGERSILMSSHITSDLEKIADCVTFIDNGRILLTGYKDEILESHGILKCSLEEAAAMDPADIISVRTNAYGAEVLVPDRESTRYKYRNAILDPASIDDVMLFYVHKGERAWC